MDTTLLHSVTDTPSDSPARVRMRLDQIWAACAARDFEGLESYHLDDPRFTSFKDGAPRTDGRANAAAERAFFGLIEDPAVDMRDLAINVFGDVAIVTFNGHYTGRIAGGPVAVDQQTTMVFVHHDDDWLIVHEHMSPLGSDRPPMR
jgi:ketosteroid isomerase-like protein